MIQLAGAALLTAAGLLCGVTAGKKLAARLSLCRTLCRMLRLMAFQLERFLTPLPELFEILSYELDGRAGALCAKAAAGLSTGRHFCDIWQEVAAGIPAAEAAVLLPLGSVLGRYGPGEQCAAVDAALGEMTALCGQMSAQIREKSRLYIAACTAGGLMLAVLLI